MTIVFVNGREVEHEDPPEASLSSRPRLPYYHFPSGVFATLRSYRLRLIDWDTHVDRLYESAERMGFQMAPYVMRHLEDQAQLVMDRNRLHFSRDEEMCVRVQISPDRETYVEARGFTPPTMRKFSVGIDAAVVDYTRPVPEAKVIDPKFSREMALLRADRGVQEILLCDSSGHVTEGATSNVFIVTNDGVLQTPGEGMLPGTTRERVLNFAEEMGIEVRLAPIFFDDLERAREVFVTSALKDVMRVRRIRPVDLSQPDLATGGGAIGFVSGRLFSALQDWREQEFETQFPL